MKWRSVIAVGSLAVLAGCSNYYAVHDNGTGALYYTRHVTEYRDGAVSFVDAKSARDMTVTNPTVTVIPEQEYNDNWRTEWTSKHGTHDDTASPAGAYISPEDQPYRPADTTVQPSDTHYQTPAITGTGAKYDQTYRQSTRQSPGTP